MGQGGFGITYMAQDTNLNHEVAIKEFFPLDVAKRTPDYTIQHASDSIDLFEWGLSRFISEAQTLARCDHPNIVSVHTVFRANQTAYIIMEYINGPSLKHLIKTHWQPSETELKKLLFTLFDGLKQVHERGFIHRDIKPENILLRDNRFPILLDFGSARHTTNKMTVLVSDGYAPFEQYDDSECPDTQGPWTDIYSLAATIYRVISGKSTVNSISRVNATMRGGHDPLTPISEIGHGDYSPQFLEAIDRALALHPADRPQSIDDWKHMFIASSGENVTLRSTSSILTESEQTRLVPQNQVNTRLTEKTAIGNPRKPDKVLASLSFLIFGLLTGNYYYQSKLEIAEISASMTTISEKTIKPRTTALQNKEATSPKLVPANYTPKVLQSDTKPDKDEIQQVTDLEASENLDNRITLLLATANQDFKALRLTFPQNNNALQRYSEVLKLDPDNNAAQKGLQRIVDRFLAGADKASSIGDFTRAENYLLKAETVQKVIGFASLRLNKAKNKHLKNSEAHQAKTR